MVAVSGGSLAKRPGAPGLPFDEAVLWHDVECASYDVDLPLWRELARLADGPVLELGCGTGRVALDLAARGHDVVGVDADPALCSELGARARRRRLPAEGVVGDIRSLTLAARFTLAIAPMQVFQLLGGPDGRRAALRSARRGLKAGSLLAVALADPLEGLEPDLAAPPLPDMREQDGWVLSSTPLSVRRDGRALRIDRLRQAVSPDGLTSESMATVQLDDVEPEELQSAARACRFEPRESRQVPATASYVGATVVVLEAA
jgi:SAM-dependent methyltransferase